MLQIMVMIVYIQKSAQIDQNKIDSSWVDVFNLIYFVYVNKFL